MKTTGNSPPSNATPKKFYAVQSGHNPGVYTDWPEAQKQITGWKGPKHRKFTTRAEAEAFVAMGINDGTPSVSSAAPARDTDSPAPTTKKVKTTKSKAVVADPGPIPLGWEPLLADAEDGFDRRLIMDPETGLLRKKTEEELNAKKPVAKVEKFAEPLQIWTDGACRGNGKFGAIAGVGVYFGKQDPSNRGEPLPGTRQTNQRAELAALKRALQLAPLNRHVHIYSDSNYAINCVTSWFQSWEKNSWKNSKSQAVENKDLIQEVLALIREREGGGVKTRFEWVKGHGTNEGNIEPDKLAVAGAEEARRVRDAGGVVPDVEDTKLDVDL
jgi:ribonuclease HI